MDGIKELDEEEVFEEKIYFFFLIGTPVHNIWTGVRKNCFKIFDLIESIEGRPLYVDAHPLFKDDHP